MDDIGNIIYIILILLGLASGLFKKKKQADQPVEREIEYEPVEAQSREDVRVAMNKKVAIEKESRDKLAALRADGKEATLSRIQQKIRQHSKKSDESSIKVNNEEDVDADVIFRHNDLKRAVICSEILNPPYI